MGFFFFFYLVFVFCFCFCDELSFLVSFSGCLYCSYGFFAEFWLFFYVFCDVDEFVDDFVVALVLVFSELVEACFCFLV